MNLENVVTCLFKFSDDMVLVGLLLNEDSLATHISHTSLLKEWCKERVMEMNVGKIKEPVLHAKKTHEYLCSCKRKQ